MLGRRICRLLMFALALASGCGRETAKTNELRIAVVPKGTTQSFWLAVKAGADDAAKEFGAKPPGASTPESPSSPGTT